MKPEQKLHSLLSAIFAALCTKTKEPLVRYVADDLKFETQVSSDDHGRCVGRSGNTIWAISAIMWHAGREMIKHPVGVSLLEPFGGRQKRVDLPFRIDPEWPQAKITKLLENILFSVSPNNHSWTVETIRPGEAIITAQIKNDPEVSGEPRLDLAIPTVIHAAGMAAGAIVKTHIKWV